MSTLLSCVSGNAVNPLQAKSEYRQAFEAKSINAKPEMYAHLNKAIQMDPNEPNFHLALGTAYLEDGDLKNAEKEFYETLKIDSNYLEAHRNLGRLYIILEKWDKAIFELKQSLSKPGVSFPQEVHNYLALCYYSKKDINSAMVEWQNALKIQENALIRLNLALALKELENDDLAIQSLKKAISLKPTLVRARHELALLLLKKKKFNEARVQFNQVSKLDKEGKFALEAQEYLQLIP
jgi:protein O-GlcNAc transferase